MNVNNVSLEAVAVKKDQYPEAGYKEIAFVGKSNVGKSSLINSMINRKALARTSQNPGKTRTINFYYVEDQLYFVDLPGYGYAKISRSESQKWGKMIEDYLLKREQLAAIILLIDIRHEPGANDKLMYEWLKHYNHDIIIAATKADKINRSQVQKHISIIKKALDLPAGDVILPFSSETKQGKDELWALIEGKAEIAQPVEIKP
jgi:GTP-binding protein